MKARWIAHLNPNPQLPIIGQTLVASWWLGRYYFVGTITAGGTSAMSRLTHALKYGGSFEDANPPEYYVTGIFRSSKDFIVKSRDPLFERTYTEVKAAREGHAEVLRALQQNCSIRSLKTLLLHTSPPVDYGAA
ncbi:MAG: hypothetical protein ACREA9_20545 [Pyrinomonadaceae bacterium]